MTEKRKKLITIIAIIVVILAGIAIAVSVLIKSGKITVYNYPESYMVKKENTHETQQGLECSGYATAYLLRHYGQDVNGHDIYNEIKNKNFDGTVPPDSIVNYLKSRGYKASLVECNSVKDLKEEVSKGHPVIAFGMVSLTNHYLHYNCVIGYDKENVYISESLPECINVQNEKYNRKISLKDYEKIWATNFKGSKHLIIKCTK